jgi:hypothetical protein
VGYRRCTHSRRRSIAVTFALLMLAAACVAQSASQSGGAPTAPVQQTIGAIKSIAEGGFTLTSDAGQEVQVTLGEAVRILRVTPGQKDLKSATPLSKQDLQVGDRVLVRGKLAPDAHSIVAAVVVAMKGSDVRAKQEKDREDWQKHGVGGLVTAVDPATGTVTISVTSFTGSKSIAVHTTKDTILRRYAPNSVKFDDARIAPLDQIRTGDQLRTRGSKNADGTELAAEEVVSGTFRNLAGTITAVDPSANSLTLKDIFTKQSVTVRVTGDAQLRKLPAEFAQHIAMRLKAGAGAAGESRAAGSAAARGDAQPGTRPSGTGQFSGGTPGGMGEGKRNGGAPDMQQVLSRMPATALTDLQRGDAVMIVSTQGDSSGVVNAITLLAGVEALLTASPSASQAMMMSPWSLGSAGVEAAANP